MGEKIIKYLEILRKVLLILIAPTILCSIYYFIIGDSKYAWSYILVYLIGAGFLVFLVFFFPVGIWLLVKKFEKIGERLRRSTK
jgi:hypothetical protein